MKTRFMLMITAALLSGLSGKLHAAWDFTATAIGGGSVDITTGTYAEGDTITVTAAPDSAGTNAFVKWSGDVSVAQKFDPVLRLTCSGGPNGTLNVTSHFGKAWYVATDGDDAVNDGSSESTAFATIAKGVVQAAVGDVVLVGPGEYTTALMTVTKGITIRGVAGAEQTRVTRTARNGIFTLNHDDAVVEDFYFHNSLGSAVVITKGTCRKSVMANGTYTSIGGIGVTMSGGLLSQCVISNNVASQNAKGTGLNISGGTAEDCLIVGNRSDGAGEAGGVYLYKGVMRNCTIVNNVSGSGAVLAQWNGTLENCIIWGNVVQASGGEIVSTLWISKAQFYNCYFPPLLETENDAEFIDCIETTVPPNFRDPANGDYRLRLGSPCIDAGRVGSKITVPSVSDLDGHARVVGVKVDIGAYEFDAGESLICDMSAPQVEGFSPLDVTLSAAVANPASGGTLTYAWTQDGAAVGSDATLALSLTELGNYTIGLTVDDGTSSATTIRTNLLYVVPQTLHVAQVNPGAAFPYATPATASTNIQWAIDASRDGSTIWVGPGTYKYDRMLEVVKGIKLRATEGPDTTILTRKPHPSPGIGLINLAHSEALITGFNFFGGWFAGCVSIWGNGGVVSNCYIKNNQYTSVNAAGLKARSGLVTHSLITGNILSTGSGVGAYLQGDAVIENCLITNNVSTGKGCIYLEGNAVIRNCTIVANKTLNGGGVYTEAGGTVENCIITDNTITGTAGPGDPNWYATGTVTNYLNNCTPVDIGTACVTDPPLFLDAANGDYRIPFVSPCFNAGINRESLIGGTDYFGNPRISATFVDIGFHEALPPPGTIFSIR